MQLHILRRTACLTIHYDSSNDWLFLDWKGNLTLPLVQEACLALGTCFLHRPYPRILNSNERVTGVSWGVAPWLITDFLPHMTLAGIKHVAWVHAASLLGQHMVQTVLHWLPGPQITRFSDMEAASQWLQQLRPNHERGFILPTRSLATQTQLTAVVQELTQRLVAKQPRLAAA
ncbi:MAG: hypothetical protein ACRYFK_10310 [Janthinobacterium lividum]